jgi:hypothetical protein
MRFTGQIKQGDEPVGLRNLLDLMPEDGARRLVGDLLRHSHLIGTSIETFHIEEVMTRADLVRVFYEQAKREKAGAWKLTLPVTLGFATPMYGGLVLSFWCQPGTYPSYTGYSIHT